jgi:hypothetical protein
MGEGFAGEHCPLFIAKIKAKSKMFLLSGIE